MAKVEKTNMVEIQRIMMSRITCSILGVTPMIMHRFDKKAQEELLFPKGRLNSAEKATRLKHDPLMEYRETIYKNRNPDAPALAHFPANAFSRAMANAALDIPGASKAQMTRLVSVASTQVNVFGVPQMFMAMVRSSDQARTPDLRTRSIFPEWALTIEIEFASSLIKEGNVVNLLAAAGVLGGIGDWRPQKGGSFGKFAVVNPDNADFKRIIKAQGRVAQEAAYLNPAYYDDFTDELYNWFTTEAGKREKVIPSASRDEMMASVMTGKKKTRGNGKHASN